ncbi:TonB-dependent receptor [Granulicella paludicola]|uniref:TonB-dependent receptor n=1 Tax=Granulicella paludicola TaxID=474951 RepID=UPI0021E034F0|nr:carboxypeptidase-like regulatory domain-containing protein [Granulicella paludicola]
MPSLLSAQDLSGMTGTVTDSTGAAISGATVVLSNKATGVKFTQTTNGSGSYRFTSVPPGQGYDATFTAPSFNPLDIQNIYLTVATTRTQDAKLLAGANTEVEVTASNSEVTINTTDAQIGNTFDVKQLNSLPVQQRNDPTALFTSQPGVTDQGSTTGARVDQNYITLDGLDVNDFATGNASQSNSGVSSGFGGAIVGHAPIDAVEEFHATVGGFTSVSGLGSGGQFQLVTKSGTNKFHGNINEYHRDPSLVANSWFSNNASPVVPRNHLIQNQFGGNIGGPILKDKLFFFFNFDDSRIIRSALTERTVPLASLRNGQVNYINSAGNIATLTSAQIAALDPASIGADSAWIAAYASRFPISNAAGGDGVNSGGYNFNAPENDFATNYTGKVDYNLTAKQKLFARFTVSHENAAEAANEFSGDPQTSPFIDRTYAFVVGHNWIIGSNKTNELILGETVENYSFPNTFNPDGSTFFTFGDGTQAALASSLYLNPSSSSRRIPVMQLADNFTWTKGSHTLQFGGLFEDIRPVNVTKADYNTVEVGLGGQTLGLNSSLRPGDIYQAPAGATAAQTTLQNTAEQTYDQAFAFVLGRLGNVQSDYNYNASGAVLPQLTGDVRIYQNYETSVYAADTWKATPQLTISYGISYQLYSVPYETRGLESVETTTFNDYMKARVAQSNAGATGPNAVPIINYVLGGKANNGPGIYQPQHNLFAPRVGFSYNPGFDRKTVFNGSAGIVYDRTIINAIQQIQDADSYLFQQTSSTPYGTPGDPVTSLKNDPRLSSAELSSPGTLAKTLNIQPPSTPTPPYSPFATPSICTALGFSTYPCGLQNGLAFNATIDPALKTPYSIAYNFGMEHTFAGDMVMKLSYMGRLGRRLLAQADANQILDFPDKASGQTLSQAFASMTLQNRAGVAAANITPQPFFENILGAGYTSFLAENYTGLVHNGDFGDFVQALAALGAPLNLGSAAQFSENSFYTSKGFSSYNALLASLQKNLSHGLQFQVNYTFAHSIDNTSAFANSSGDTGIGGIGLICDDIRPRECRANSDFDITNYVTANATYQLPVGRHRAFLSNAPLWLEEMVGGWDISGITDWHSGIAWGTNSNAFDASYSNDAPGILVGSKNLVQTHLQKLAGGGVNIFANQAAAQGAYTGPVGFTIGARNGLRGPKFFNQDLGLAKNFPIYSDRLNLKFRADAFNAFNHPNFALPQSNAFNGYDQQDVTSSTFGNITSTVEPAGNLNNGARVVQVALRLEF